MGTFLIRTESAPIGDILICRDDDGCDWYVPSDPDNTHYAQYLQWLDAGNDPEPWAPVEL